MKNILFVCHGNICRSPMAEYIMKDLVKNAGVDDIYHIESAATSREEIGNDLYPKAKEKLREKGIPYGHHSARQVVTSDYAQYDYIIGMDQVNHRNLVNLFHGDPEGKVSLLMDWTGNGRSISDPWYSGDFETTFREIVEGAEALLDRLENRR